MLSTRLDLFRSLPRGAVVCEVGTFAGLLASEIKAIRPDITLVCVDNWAGDFIRYRKDAIEKLADIKAVAVCTDSITAAGLLGRVFDCVYIDAMHDYASVRADVLAWKRCVKPGGILGGHDMETKDVVPLFGRVDVERAVNDLVTQNLLPAVNVIKEDAPSWWCVLS